MAEPNGRPEICGVSVGNNLKVKNLNVQISNTTTTDAPQLSSSENMEAENPNVPLPRKQNSKRVTQKLEDKCKILADSGDIQPLATIFRLHLNDLHRLTAEPEKLAQLLHDYFILSRSQLKKIINSRDLIDEEKNRLIYENAFQRGKVSPLIAALENSENDQVIEKMDVWIG